MLYGNMSPSKPSVVYLQSVTVQLVWLHAEPCVLSTRVASLILFHYSCYSFPGLQDPVVVLNKNKRHDDVDELKGPAHYNHLLRKALKGAKATIVPDFFKTDEGDSSDK